VFSVPVLVVCGVFLLIAARQIGTIGNPQNLLIALHGNIPHPFLTFLGWLFVPTVLCLFLAFFALDFVYRDGFQSAALAHSQEPIRDHDLSQLARTSIWTVLVLIAATTATPTSSSSRPRRDGALQRWVSWSLRGLVCP
jgi:Na+/H+ antiporter NhaD/arsenite permease-like protein